MARLTTLLFAMWLGVTVSTEVDVEKRVIGGQVCGPKERLYHVVLIDTVGKKFLCSGSLISDQWILTVAHCYEPGRKFTALVGRHAGPLQEVPIIDDEVIFADDRYGQQHDLMLLKLPKAVEGIKPVTGPNCAAPPKIGAKVQIAGHGSTTCDLSSQRQPGLSDTLQCADMDLIDCQRFRIHMCQNDETIYSERHHNQWICTTSTSADACYGDSGGGVVYQDRIYGVIQFGHPTFAGAWPLASMDLCYKPYLFWINRIINQPSKNAAFGSW